MMEIFLITHRSFGGSRMLPAFLHINMVNMRTPSQLEVCRNGGDPEAFGPQEPPITPAPVDVWNMRHAQGCRSPTLPRRPTRDGSIARESTAISGRRKGTAAQRRPAG